MSTRGETSPANLTQW